MGNNGSLAYGSSERGAPAGNGNVWCRYVTAITTVMDSREGLLRLEQACLETDERIGRMMIAVQEKNRKKLRKRIGRTAREGCLGAQRDQRKG